MKMATSAAATALASLYARDKLLVDRSFSHMTNRALQTIDKALLHEYNQVPGSTSQQTNDLQKQQECNLALAQACVRRTAFCYLHKYARLLSSPDVVEDALKYYTLPAELQQRLANKYGSGDLAPPPTTWYESLEQLKLLATTDGMLDKGKLWRLILDHPMTAYIPVQCQHCGRVVRDQYPLQQTDEEVGIKEVPPKGTELELRAGWFRGPRKAIVFELTCPHCQSVSQWYRSGHPKILLNPNKWGRLCGDQEDLRLILAEHLNIPVRLVVPLDWDHVWSEYEEQEVWKVQDGSSRNFRCRLDEKIGSWTGVWAVHKNPDWCGDVTREYLTTRKEGGRADDRDDKDNDNLERYEKIVRDAQNDASGNLTQAQTCNGYILARAMLTHDDITMELRQAASDYGTKEWWQLRA